MTDVSAIRRDTIGAAVSRAARRFGPKVALIFDDSVWTYRALDEVTDRIAARLRREGLKPGDRVVAFGRNSDLYLLAWIGCCKAGVIHVPANPAFSIGELAYIIVQCGAALVVHDQALQAVARDAGVGASLLFEDLLLPAACSGDATHDGEVSGDDIAQILYTSGTTGRPKGAMMTHRALLAEYASCLMALEISCQDRALAALPLYHSAALHVFAMPQLLVGATIHLVESPAPALCLGLIERHGLNSFFAPPTVWIGLLRHPDFAGRDLTSLRRLYYGAAIMPLPVLQELQARLPGIRAFNCYGQSELGPLATVLSPEAHAARPTSVGHPVLNVETRVIDDNLDDVLPGVRGEIVHRSPQLMLGYWDNPAETAEAFSGGWFHSGDIGTMDSEGYIYVVDRLKDVINTGGVLVASREVEDALFTHDAVLEVAVISVPDSKWIEAIAAIVVLRDGACATEAELTAHAKGVLAPYKVPKHVFFVDSLPKNASGKLLKRELRLRFTGVETAVLGVA